MGKTVIDPTKDRTDEDDTGTEDEETDDTGTDTDEDEGSESDEDDEDDEEDDDATTLKSLGLSKEQLAYVKGLQDKVTKANAQSAAKRRQLVELRKAGRKAPVVKPTEPTKKTATGDAPDFAAALAQFKAEAAEERRVERVTSRAETELRKAGLALDPNDSDAADRKVARALKLLDLDDLEPEDVADAVAELKADSPELFKRRRKVKPRTGGVSGPARAGGGGKAPDAVEKALDL